MKRIFLLALGWVLIFAALYTLIKAVVAILVTADVLPLGYLRKLPGFGIPRGIEGPFWMTIGVFLTLAVGYAGFYVLDEARETPKKIHLMRFLFGVFGRATRKDYWLVLLFWIVTVLIIMGIIQLVDYLLPSEEYYTFYSDDIGRHIEAWMGAPSWIREPEKAILFFWMIGGLISMVIVSVRRLHDRNRGGWWLLPMYVLAPWAIVELGFLSGAKGVNPYGPEKISEDWN